MSLCEMHSELQDDTSAPESRLWLQMHLLVATLPSYSSLSLLGEEGSREVTGRKGTEEVREGKEGGNKG